MTEVPPKKKLPPAGQISAETSNNRQSPSLHDSSRVSPSLPDPPIRQHHPPPPPKNDLIGTILAGLAMCAVLIVFALAYWWLNR
jgi:hypothetical protein